MAFEVNLEVQLRKDEEGRVRQLSHPLKPYSASDAGLDADQSLRALADQYVRDIQPILSIPLESTTALPDAFETTIPSDAPMELRFAGEKRIAESATVTYAQTQFDIPVWNAGVTVRMRSTPMEVTGASNSVHYELNLPKPSERAPYLPNNIDAQVLVGLFPPGVVANPKITRTNLWVFYFDPEERLDPESRAKPPGVAFEQGPPTLPLNRLPQNIRAGQHYVVTEVLFGLPVPGFHQLNWRAMIEVETGAVLYLRALIACVGRGCVFSKDPVTLHGDGVSAHSPADVLDSLREEVDLTAVAPVPPQSKAALRGPLVELREVSHPTAVLPTEPSPFEFVYSSKSGKFAAVNAYHHCDAIFRFIEGLGIPLSDYFDGTQFPVPVDHDALGKAVNAQAPGNSTGDGSGGFLFGRAATGTDVGIAADVRVVWHEFGHALLWDHVRSPNFGFAHSAGDAIGAILYDPGTKAGDRFETFPFMEASAGLSRRHDRPVTAGWAWGGPVHIDDRQYGSEQILSTTLFRLYQACGGEDSDPTVQQFAARYVVYLIIKGIGLLSFMSRDPRVYVDALIESDVSTGLFEGHPGGAFHKVIRWSFEQQGLYQPPGAPRPVQQPGAPPDVDVYIDDSRHGHYMPYLSAIDATEDIWNRHSPDGGHVHQSPQAGVSQSLYVRIKNRGTVSATNVTVRAFQSARTNPQWGTGWTPLAAPLQVNGSLASGGELIAGPISWNPNGTHPKILVSVHAAGDPANIDLIAAPIPLARLVPTDNNLAMRTM
jgi:hypothetical protein